MEPCGNGRPQAETARWGALGNAAKRLALRAQLPRTTDRDTRPVITLGLAWRSDRVQNQDDGQIGAATAVTRDFRHELPPRWKGPDSRDRLEATPTSP